MPKKRNQSGAFLCEIGTDTAKEMLTPEWGGYCGLPTKPRLMRSAFRIIRDVFTEWEAKQLVAEELVEKLLTEKFRLLWDASDVVTKRWIVLFMPVQRYGSSAAPSNRIWRRWRHQGKAKSRIPRHLNNWPQCWQEELMATITELQGSPRRSPLRMTWMTGKRVVWFRKTGDGVEFTATSVGDLEKNMS